MGCLIFLFVPLAWIAFGIFYLLMLIGKDPFKF